MKPRIDYPGRKFSEHPKSAHWSYEDNGKIRPENLTWGSARKVWFICDNAECGHKFQQMPAAVQRGVWCPYCKSYALCSDESCKVCLEKSFASCESAKWWSPKNELSPRMVRKGTSKKFYFICDECGHESYSALKGMNTVKRCNFCYGKKLCTDEKCDMCKEASFASHPYAVYWSPKNKQTPREVFKMVRRKYYFDCSCGHEAYMKLGSLVNRNDCNYCCKGSQILCEKECEFCKNRSFASHELSKFWSDTNEKTARQTFKCSSIKVWFNCDQNSDHNFKMRPFDVVSGRWCPFCTRKGERKLYDALSKSYDLTREKSFPWLLSKKGYRFRFDFRIVNRKILIELDGDHHFKQMMNWPPLVEHQETDMYKMGKANEKGYSVIRITWEIVYRNRNNWLEQLIESIEHASSLKEGKWQNYFISSGNEYSFFFM